MTPAEVIDRVNDLRALAGDPEAASSAEDAIWHDALQAIANGTVYARAIAHAALLTRDVQFPRWRA